MKTITVAVLIFLSLSDGRGQINLQEIKTLTSDPASRYFYDTLLVEFLERPGEFEMTMSICLYYGKLFSRFYKPYDFSEAKNNFEELVRREDYQRAISVGERVLEQDAVDLVVLLNLLRCYVETKDQELAELTRRRATVLHKAILHSGTGEASTSPLQVISIGDEYATMALMQVQPVSRSSEMKGSSVVDHWKVRPAGKGRKKDLYFEVLLNYE